MTAASRLCVRIGATEEAIAHLAAGIRDDEAVLRLLADGTPPADTPFGTEDECADFIADARKALTAKQAELEGLRERLRALMAGVPA